MADRELFNENELRSLVDLVDAMQKADPKGKVYRVPLSTSDTLLNLIDKDKGRSIVEKNKLKDNINKRKKNQRAVEELSKHATDIQRGKSLLRIREEQDERGR